MVLLPALGRPVSQTVTPFLFVTTLELDALIDDETPLSSMMTNVSL
jgi:hypothetical protein